MSRDLTVTFPCPLCDGDSELTATIQPGTSGSRDTPPSGAYIIDLVGCSHADQYSEGIANPTTERALDEAGDEAWDEAGRAALEDADESRYDAWEGRRDDD